VINSEVEATAATSDAAPQGTVDALFEGETEQAFRA
jgi:hypothetical protein